MPKRKYVSRNPQVSNDLAQIIGETIANKGITTAAEFVDEAIKKSSPLHDLLPWDDKEAAYQFRLERARVYMRSVALVVKDNREVKYLHAVAEVVSDPDRIYKTHQVVLNTDYNLAELSERFYNAIVAECKKAEDLGMHEKDPAWSKIITAVRKNKPDISMFLIE